MNNMTILSVGIDIGTTTTHLIISRISLKNRMPGSQIPKIEISNKEIVYRSKIHMTPLIHHSMVDSGALKKIIEEEYLLAGLSPEQVDTGAVIITGETAKKENAEAIVQSISKFAGDFVVAVAGPDVESILAGKGSGAMELSRQNRSCIINLDIGGGTTNIAVFNDGNITNTACINVGGRLVEVDSSTGKLQYISEPIQRIIKYTDIDLEEGYSTYKDLCKLFVSVVDACVFGESPPNIFKSLIISNSLKKNHNANEWENTFSDYDGVMFSGGVGELLYDKKSIENPYLYGDLGPILADAFLNSRMVKKYPVLEPKEKISATVIGAGNYSMEVSGSTIFIDWDNLPVKNVPVTKVELDSDDIASGKLLGKIRDALKRISDLICIDAIGICLSLSDYPSYTQIVITAEAIIQAWDEINGRSLPLIILLEKDFGKVLGQTMRFMTKGRGNFASIDSVSIQEGDYIDIGKPIFNGDIVPLVVKTLIFQSGGISI